MIEQKIVVVDIDGTIAKVPKERMDFLESGNTNWNEFYDMDFSNDKPIFEIIELVWNLTKHYEIVFCTGRSEIIRDVTEKWLRSYSLFGKLLMRPNDCEVADAKMKPALLLDNNITFDNIAFILEDKNCVVNEWRNLGIKCLQVENNIY